MQTAAPDSLVGRSLEGRYRILERIARGGMSIVYAAVDERLDRLVAVKVMSATFSDNAAFSDRFAREARAAARLTHLNAVSVYDQGQELAPDGRHVFLVMELVEGRTLRELLRERGRLDPALAISIMEPVLSALSAAHRAGLVHRDVKPENILLSDDGIVKVVDFGLARATESDAAATRTGLMMGTVAYCSPEQISRGAADPRSDVYSAGVVLFELLTGAPPYRGDSPVNVAYQHVHSRVPAPSSKVDGVPERIDELVVAATDSDPSGRPADASAFLAEVADVRADLALPVVPIPPRRRPGPRRVVEPRSPENATTQLVRDHGPHDTALVPETGTGADAQRTSHLPNRAGPEPVAGSTRTGPVGARRPATGPPPPVVIPPGQADRAKRRRRRRWAIVILVLVLLLGAAAGYAGWWFASGRYSHIPHLNGASKSEAINRLEHAGYDYKIVEPGSNSYSDTVAKGLVLRTAPEAGARLVRGKTVLVYLSAGPHYYTIPKVGAEAGSDVEKTFEQARAALRAAGPLSIAAKPKYAHNDHVRQSYVIGTEPADGTRVTADQTVTIIVSKGPPYVDVPPIPQGMTFTEAEQALQDADFEVDRHDEYSNTVMAGSVIQCTPSGQARKFSTITCTVSMGPRMVTVPEIALGMSVDDAEQALADAGLLATVVPVAGDEPLTVLTIDPKSGASVEVGTTVKIYALSA